ncbi:AEC family transporter [Acuticoccus mangrovi]|uniref:AEC family transporter n=1 Tax=Acuticoccus mangrovi TaxID=2796142 RepID=A0A934IQJ3_9HYPH|nr:AEC family transporter [Acuticoccus mangrovi]MBJ3776871.1 AEC family transporter [Acuticoccus mangrovi]
MSLNALLSIVLPVFGFIGIGYGVIWGRILKPDVGDGLGSFVFTIAVPTLLFRAIGTLKLPDISPWPYWLAYFCGVLITVGIGALLVEKAFGRDARAGVIGGLSSSFSNTVMVGLPIVTQAFGDEGLVTGFLLVAIHLPVMMTISAILIEVAEYRDGTGSGGVRITAALQRVFYSLMFNPLVIAILAGAAFRLTGLPLTGIPRTIIDRISDTAIPLALVAMGMSLHKYGISGNVRPALALTALKLLGMPAVVYVLAVHVAGLPPIAASVAVVMAACPTGVNAYLIATRFRTGLALSANTISLTTVLSILTFTLWLSVVGA